MPYNLVNVFFLFFAEVSEAPIFPVLPNMFVTFLCSNMSVTFLYSNVCRLPFVPKQLKEHPPLPKKERTDALLPNEQAK